MKIILSKNLLGESQATVMQIGSSVSLAIGETLPIKDLSADELIEQMVREGNKRYSSVTRLVDGNGDDQVAFEIDDHVIIALLRVYSKFANLIGSAISIIRPALKGVAEEYLNALRMFDEPSL